MSDSSELGVSDLAGNLLTKQSKHSSQILLVSRSWETVSIDLVWLLPISMRGYNSLVVMQDRFRKSILCRPPECPVFLQRVMDNILKGLQN